MSLHSVASGKRVSNQTLACMPASRRFTLSANTGQVGDVNAYNIVHSDRRDGRHDTNPARRLYITLAQDGILQSGLQA